MLKYVPIETVLYLEVACMRMENWEIGLMQPTAKNKNKAATENSALHTYCSRCWHRCLLNVHMLCHSRKNAEIPHCLRPQAKSSFSQCRHDYSLKRNNKSLKGHFRSDLLQDNTILFKKQSH